MLPFLRKQPKFNADLKRLLENAEARARQYSHDYVGVEHVFLCLRNLPESDEAAKALKLLPVDAQLFWEDLERQTKVVTGRPVPKTLPRTPRLNWVLRSAMTCATAGRQDEVTPLHFLAGVGQDRNSLVAHVFRGYFMKQNPEYTNAHAIAAHLVMRLVFPYAALFRKEEEPNQLLQPTPSSVTPPAAAGAAPDPGPADR